MSSKPSPSLLDQLGQQAGLNAPLRLLKPLEGGTLNQLYLLQCDDRQLVLKQDSGGKACGSNWHESSRLHRQAATLGMAPLLLVADRNHQLLLMDYAGEPVTPPVKEQQIEQAGVLLGKLHRSDIALPARSYEALLSQLVRQARERHIETGCLDQVTHIAKAWDNLPFCWCHHDVNAGNLLQHRGQLQLVDWEYSGSGNALFDLAGLCNSWQLNARQTKLLLRAQGGGYQPADLQPAHRLMQVFDQLWFAIYQPNA